MWRSSFFFSWRIGSDPTFHSLLFHNTSSFPLSSSCLHDCFAVPGEDAALNRAEVILFLLSRHKPSASFSLSLIPCSFTYSASIFWVWCYKSRRQAKPSWMSFPIGNIVKQNRYSTVDVDWNVLCLFSHALFVMPGRDWTVWALCSPRIIFPFVFSPAQPAATVNQAPALYRQSNLRRTLSKPTSTSCPLSWHVNPNVPASSSPRWTVYRSVRGVPGPHTTACSEFVSLMWLMWLIWRTTRVQKLLFLSWSVHKSSFVGFCRSW